MTTNKTNTTRSEKLFFIAAPAMFAVYALLCIYFDNMPKGIFYTTTFIMFVLMLAIIPGFFSFIKAKDKYYAENIRPGIRHSIPGIIVSLTSVITFFSFYLKIPLLIFLIQPLIVLASQYAEDIIFVKDRNKSASAKFSNSPIFGKSFLNQNKKFGYSIHDLSKTSKLAYIAAVFLSVYMALQPVGCLCTVAAIWLILREKAGFSVLAYKNRKIRRIRFVLSLLAGIILLIYFSCALGFMIFDKEISIDDTVFPIIWGITVFSLYIPVLWLYAESWIMLHFLESKKRETDSNVCVNNQTSKKILAKSFFTETIGFLKNLCLKIINTVKKIPIPLRNLAIIAICIAVLSYCIGSCHRHRAVVAAENAEKMLASIKNTAASEYKDVKNRKTVQFGKYPYDENGKVKPIEWLVLAQDGTKALLISKYAIDNVKYNEKEEKVTWEKSTIRKWLNNEFKDYAFTAGELERIINSHIENKGNAKYGTKGGKNTKDGIFLLSIEEAAKYFGSDDDRKALPTPYANSSKSKEGGHLYPAGDGSVRWWLRTPGENNKEAGYVYSNGYLSDIYSITVTGRIFAVRPAMWVDFSLIP